VINANGFVTEMNSDMDRLPSALEIRRCEDWLRENSRMITKKVYRGSTSYGWKHVVEFDKSYVSNGAFLQACVNMGVPVVQQRSNGRGELNGYVALSRKVMTKCYERKNSGERGPKHDEERVYVYT
jgi:hypothetical protein